MALTDVQDEPLVSAWLTQLSFDWTAATEGARQIHVAQEETLFLEGKVADAVYVIDQGRIRLTSFSLDGRERHLMIVGATGLVGDCALHACRQHVVTAVAATDSVVTVVPVHKMVDAIAHNSAIARQCQELSSTRFRIMLQHLALQASNSALRRVCHHLVGLMNSYGSPHSRGTAISISFTQQEMGNICGLSRVSVSTIFTRLESEGVIGRSGRSVLICDARRLQEMARS